ncbi:DUF1707 domain-containing protein [Streptomyces sp. NRRL S-87]|uniref:DUF1707 SHOCT-like domain-containing protein n=1 Tax=Streptomyces sp. NRRL S-87 TaxID=1463920 RepID=UPI0004BEBEA3|nr:DUF1707 domain-containing protein [Streptomyces sp. NRRL S-87]
MDLEKHPAGDAALRASDADRDRIGQILADALAEGRLTAEEHAERLDSLYALKTVGELETLVRDLPGAHRNRPAPLPAPEAAPAYAAPGEADTVVAVCSSAVRKGRWRPRARTQVVSVMGDVEIDLSEAVFEQQVVELRVVSVLGNIEIKVPENVTLRSHGGGILGAFEVVTTEAPDPGAPVVILRGFSLLGNVEAKPRAGRRLADLSGRLRGRAGS